MMSVLIFIFLYFFLFLYSEIEKEGTGVSGCQYGSCLQFPSWPDDSYFVLIISHSCNIILLTGKNRLIITPTYRRMCWFNVLLHLLFFLTVRYYLASYSILAILQESENLARKSCMHIYSSEAALPGKSTVANVRFVSVVVTCLYIIEFALWLNILLLCSGDVHPNPGPLTSLSSDSILSSSSTMSTTIFSSINTSLSFVHYNIQSIFPKLDILHAELIDFDILAFTETWLSPTDDTDDLLFQSYNGPERKDRVSDNHGGVLLYVKENIHYKRRLDLEIKGIESIWIELSNKHKRILFGLFYRPPNSDINYYLDIENSLHLAIDTDISDIIVTGDFKFNMLSPLTSRKKESFCTQFSLFQSITDPTHFTEHSSSFIGILLVSTVDSRYLEIEGTLKNSSRYPYFDISDL